MQEHLRAITAVAVAAAAAAAAAYEFERHLWRERLLFLIAADADDPVLEQQNRTLARCRNGVVDRDLRVFRLYRHKGESPDGPLAVDQVLELRRRLGVEPDESALILAGKDGGIKRRAALDTDLAEIFAQIDGMPMRRREMHGRPTLTDCVGPP